jgi:hypothetical protein
MATARLRVFPRTEEKGSGANGSPCVPVRLMELYLLLAQAYRDHYVWLRDFEEEELLVTPDLYEVVRAFTDCKPSA